MKKPNIKVTVNSGEHKGKIGLLVGYDRDKYYEVLFDDGSKDTFKGYYLDDIDRLKGHQRYLLQYPFSERVLSHKELNQDRKFYTNRGKGTHKKSRYFHIEFESNGRDNNRVDEDYFYDLDFCSLKKKVRCAMQEGINFYVGMTINRKNSTTSFPLIAYSGIITTFGAGRNRKISSFERGIIKEINKYYREG